MNNSIWFHFIIHLVKFSPIICEFWKSIQHSQKKLKDEIVKYVNSTFQISIRQPKRSMFVIGNATWLIGIKVLIVKQYHN